LPSIVRQGNFEAAKAALRVQRVEANTTTFIAIIRHVRFQRLVSERKNPVLKGLKCSSMTPKALN
jgi:hypothetical protein